MSETRSTSASVASDRSGRPGRSGRSAHFAALGGLVTHFVDSWRDVPRARSLTGDLLSGLTVAAVALPLNVGLAIASGMPPIAGLVAGAVGGLVAGLMGSSSLGVSGPAAALSVMVLALSKDFGVQGVAAATIYVGLVELVLAFALAGRVIKHVPESVLAGFTTGVGLKLLDQQLPELLGFPEVVDWAAKGGNATTIDLFTMMHRPKWLHDVSWLAAISGVFVAFVVTSMRPFKRFPAAIVSIALITFVSIYLKWDIERVASVGAVPSRFPSPSLPLVADERWIDLFMAATPLALLGAAESLLSASAIDRMGNVKKPHDSNVELFGQGLANIATGFFSGMPVTGVVARSGVNVQSGGKTRLATIFHALILAASVMFLSGHISRVPLAALAGLLCVIGFRLLEVRTLVHLYKEHKLEAVAFVVAAAGTVSGHLMTGLVAALAIHFANRWLHRHERAELAQLAENKSKGIRAVLAREKGEARRPAHMETMPSEHRKWLGQLREQPLAAASAFVHPAATVIGRVILGEHVHIAADTSVRADEGSPFHIGANTNIQDGVVMHALKDQRVLVAGESWAVYVGKNVSLAHDALVHGPCYIGDETFVGFKAVVHDSIVGANCFIGIGAVVVGVEIPDGKYVPHGRIVDSADAVDMLPPASEAHRHFNEDVVEVNRGLALAYHRHTREGEDIVVAAERRANPDHAEVPIWDVRWSRSPSKERF